MKASASRDENCILIIRHLTHSRVPGFLLALPAFLSSAIFFLLKVKGREGHLPL